MTKPYVIGIAGPTGSGKSTLAARLQEEFAGQVTVMHLDDYFVDEKDLPVLEGELNWDDPSAVRHKDLVSDLQKLRSGQPVFVMTADTSLNPDFAKTKQKIRVELQPRPLIVVEGFYALYFPDLRQEFNRSIYLEGDYKETVKRRVHPMWDHYRDNVLGPMHEKYLVPTKAHADLTIDVGSLDKVGVLKEVIKLLPKSLNQRVSGGGV